MLALAAGTGASRCTYIETVLRPIALVIRMRCRPYSCGNPDRMHFAAANHERLAIQQESPTENSNRCGLCRVPAGCAGAADGTARTRAGNALGGASTLMRKKTRRRIPLSAGCGKALRLSLSISVHRRRLHLIMPFVYAYKIHG